MRRRAAQAIAAQADALDAFTIEGIRHNIPFLAALMQHKRWQAGKLSTGFIAEEYPDGFHPTLPDGRERARAGCGRGRDRSRARRAQAPHFGPAAGPAVTRERRRIVRLGEAEIALDIAREGEALAVRFEGAEGQTAHALASRWQPGDALWERHVRRAARSRCRCGRC